MSPNPPAPIHQWFVPGRVNLIGEHLDHNGGLTLPFAIDRGTTVKARRRDDGQVAVWSGGERVEFPVAVSPGDVDGWAAYVAGTVWAWREWGHEVPGADVVVESNLPRGAGLASSAALTCGVALTLADLSGATPDRHTIAALAQRAETEFVGVPVGRMDQLAVLFAEADHTVLIDHRSDRPTTELVACDPAAAGLSLAVIDTRVHHDLAAGEYAVRRAECAAAAAELGLEHLSAAPLDALFALGDPTLAARTRHVVTETTRVRGAVKALRDGKWEQLGMILTSGHTSLRDDFEVSCPELDLAVDTALESGALGARLTGGGFGGSVVALVPTAKAPAMVAAVTAAFTARGFVEPVVAPVRVATGARRTTDR